MILTGQFLQNCFSISRNMFFSFHEKFFYFSGNIFYFSRNVFHLSGNILFLGEWFLFLGKRFFISQETFLYFPGNDFFSTIIRCLWFRKSKPNVNRLPRVHMTPHQLGQPTKRSSAREGQPTKRSSARGDRKFTEKK